MLPFFLLVDDGLIVSIFFSKFRTFILKVSSSHPYTVLCIFRLCLVFVTILCNFNDFSVPEQVYLPVFSCICIVLASASYHMRMTCGCGEAGPLEAPVWLLRDRSSPSDSRIDRCGGEAHKSHVPFMHIEWLRISSVSHITLRLFVAPRQKLSGQGKEKAP